MFLSQNEMKVLIGCSPSLQNALDFIKKNYSKKFSLEDVAKEAGFNKFYLTRIFKKTFGMSSWEYLNRYRIEQAKFLLQDSFKRITEIAYEVGFDDLSHFEELFKRYNNCTPKEFRKSIFAEIKSIFPNKKSILAKQDL